MHFFFRRNEILRRKIDIYYFWGIYKSVVLIREGESKRVIRVRIGLAGCILRM